MSAASSALNLVVFIIVTPDSFFRYLQILQLPCLLYHCCYTTKRRPEPRSSNQGTGHSLLSLLGRAGYESAHSVRGHPGCAISTSQQIPSSPLGPPPGHSPPPPPPLSGGGASSLLEQPLNAIDIENANMSAASKALNLDVFIIVSPDTYYFVIYNRFFRRANFTTVVIRPQFLGP